MVEIGEDPITEDNGVTYGLEMRREQIWRPRDLSLIATLLLAARSLFQPIRILNNVAE